MLGRLTGWTRIGIVLSVLWALTILAWAVHDLGVASRLIDGLFAKCASTPKSSAAETSVWRDGLNFALDVHSPGQMTDTSGRRNALAAITQTIVRYGSVADVTARH